MHTTRAERQATLSEYYRLKTENSPKALRIRDRIAQQNDGLAIKTARRLQATCKEELEDLKQIARIGLLKAIERFDPTKGNAFSSFAVPYIRGEILHYLRDHWSLLKVPRRWLETFEEVERIQKRLDRPVDSVLIAQALGVSAERWQEIQNAFECNLVSIDELTHLGSDEEPEENDLYQSAIVQAAKLPHQMRLCVLEHLFGKLRDKAIARKYQLDPQQVRLLIAEGLKRLQVYPVQTESSPNV